MYCALDRERFVKLTSREMEVLSLIFAGYSSMDTAKNLNVSKRTIDFHLKKIYEKLQVYNRVQAYRRLERFGMLPKSIVK